MKKEKEIMDVVFILDRSGSMMGTETDTIGGYNNYIKSYKDKNAKITTVLFDHMYEMITKRKDVKEVEMLSEKEYFTRGSTALLDAIGKTIEFMEKKKSKKAIFIITTDGYENASRYYNREQIKQMIKKHDEWEFIYIGADIDSYSEGTSLGIDRKNISNYKKTSRGISKLFDAMYFACEEYDEGNDITTSWKKDLENYVDENIKIDW